MHLFPEHRQVFSNSNQQQYRLREYATLRSTLWPYQNDPKPKMRYLFGWLTLVGYKIDVGLPFSYCPDAEFKWNLCWLQLAPSSKQFLKARLFAFWIDGKCWQTVGQSIFMFFHRIPTNCSICPNRSRVRIQLKCFRIKLFSDLIFLSFESIVTFFLEFQGFVFISHDFGCLDGIRLMLIRCGPYRMCQADTAVIVLNAIWKPKLSHHWTHDRTSMISIDWFLLFLKFFYRQKLQWSQSDNVIATIATNRMTMKKFVRLLYIYWVDHTRKTLPM